MSRLALAALGGCLLVQATACARSNPAPESSVAPASEYNLVGTWEWQYDRYNMVSPCMLSIWQEGSRWRGWFVQHPDADTRCLMVNRRLARAQIRGDKVSLDFSLGPSRTYTPFRYRFEFVSPSRLEGHIRGRAAASITLVRRSNQANRPQ